MTYRVWLLVLAAGWFAAGRAAAQDDPNQLDVNERSRLADIRDKKKDFDPQTDQELVNKAARWAVLRLTDEVHRGLKTGTPTPMNDLVNQAARLVLEPPAPPATLTRSHNDYIQAYGKAALVHLRTLLLGTKEKPTPYELLVRVNAARILSGVAKSGYEETADLAIDVIENPKESDAVRLFAFQALRNLFSAPNGENPRASLVTRADRELKAVQTLIAFIVRKPPLAPDAATEEYEAIRYVRREAVRALGSVRKPVIRKDKAIVAEPAQWLIKVASSDADIPLPPSLSERIEATIGYFQLNPERGQNVDYAIYYLGQAIVEFAQIAKSRAEKDTGEPTPGKEVPVRDTYAWKVAGARLLGTMKEWKDAWELEHPNPPQPAGKMVTDLHDKVKAMLLDPLLSTAKVEIEPGPLQQWWEGQTWPNKVLYKDAPNSVVNLPKRD